VTVNACRVVRWPDLCRPHRFSQRVQKTQRGFARQLHSSSNGGSLEQGRIDGLLAPPPLDAAMPLGVAALLDVDGVDTLGDP
jgi:hypothetical protein